MTSILPLYEAAQVFVERAAALDAKDELAWIVRSTKTQVAAVFARQSAAFLRNFEAHQGEFREATGPVPPGFEESWDKAALETAAALTRVIDRAARLALAVGARQAEALIGLSFNLTNPRAVAYLARYGARQVTGINDTTRELLRTVLADGIAAGDSYQRIARALRARMVEMAPRRARLIAVTEAGNAYEEGNLIVGLDAARAGLSMEKSWLTAQDEKVDPHCSANEGAGWIPIEQAFPSGAHRPLDHPGCRCSALYRRQRTQ